MKLAEHAKIMAPEHTVWQPLYRDMVKFCQEAIKDRKKTNPLAYPDSARTLRKKTMERTDKRYPVKRLPPREEEGTAVKKTTAPVKTRRFRPEPQKYNDAVPGHFILNKGCEKEESIRIVAPYTMQKYDLLLKNQVTKLSWRFRIGPSLWIRRVSPELWWIRLTNREDQYEPSRNMGILPEIVERYYLLRRTFKVIKMDDPFKVPTGRPRVGQINDDGTTELDTADQTPDPRSLLLGTKPQDRVTPAVGSGLSVRIGDGRYELVSADAVPLQEGEMIGAAATKGGLEEGELDSDEEGAESEVPDLGSVRRFTAQRKLDIRVPGKGPREKPMAVPASAADTVPARSESRVRGEGRGGGRSPIRAPAPAQPAHKGGRSGSAGRPASSRTSQSVQGELSLPGHGWTRTTWGQDSRRHASRARSQFSTATGASSARPDHPVASSWPAVDASKEARSAGRGQGARWGTPVCEDGGRADVAGPGRPGTEILGGIKGVTRR